MPNFEKKKTLCKWCAYYMPDPDAKNSTGLCVKSPPVPVVIPSMNPITGQMGAGIQSVVPMVAAESGCHSGYIASEPGEIDINRDINRDLM